MQQTASVDLYLINLEDFLWYQKIFLRKKEQILKEYHITSKHGLPQTMKFMILRKYKWENIVKDIEKYCEVSMIAGNSKVNIKNRVLLTKSHNELWEVDLIGRIESGGKNKFIWYALTITVSGYERKFR